MGVLSWWMGVAGDGWCVARGEGSGPVRERGARGRAGSPGRPGRPGPGRWPGSPRRGRCAGGTRRRAAGTSASPWGGRRPPRAGLVQGVAVAAAPARPGRRPCSAARTQRGVAEVGEQVVADVLLEEEQVVLAGDLVADHRDADAVLARRGRGTGGRRETPLRVGSATRNVRSKRVNRPEAKASAPGGHVDHDVLAGAVDQVVQVELDRAELGVVAGHPEVALVERAGHHQRYAAHASDVPARASRRRRAGAAAVSRGPAGSS